MTETLKVLWLADVWRGQCDQWSDNHSPDCFVHDSDTDNSRLGIFAWLSQRSLSLITRKMGKPHQEAGPDSLTAKQRIWVLRVYRQVVYDATGGAFSASNGNSISSHQSTFPAKLAENSS